MDISFCLPVYNVKNYLHDCILSIVSQNLEIDKYEVVCVDDLSTDGSWAELERLKHRYSQIRIYRNAQNIGVSATRNKCLEYAVGDYIWFVDPDDMLYPGVVSSFIECGSKTKENIIRGNYIRAKEDASFSDFLDTERTLAFEKKTFSEGYVITDADGTRDYTVWGGMYRRQFLLHNNLFLNEKMFMQEDVLYAYELSLVSDTVLKTESPCYIYRIRQSSAMHQISDKRMFYYYISMRTMLEVYINHLKNEEYKNKAYLEERIHYLMECVAKYLCFQNDRSFVRNQLSELKKMGFYPYPLRWECFKQSSKLRAVFEFVLPIR